MEEIMSKIEAHPFFDGISKEYTDVLGRVTVQKKFKAGENLIKEGSLADQFFLITKGRVNILTPKLSRDEEILEPSIIQTLGDGDVLGWSWFVPPYEWRFDAKAIIETEALALNAETLRALCEKDASLGYQLLKRLVLTMVERLAATRLELATHHAKPFEQAEGG